MRIGGCGKRRSPGIGGGCECGPGRGADRTSGSPDHPVPGSDLCGNRAKEQCGCMAVFKAMDAVRDQRTMPVPVHLQDRHYKGAEKLGHGAGYKYAHDYPKHYVKQQYLPDGMEGAVFYEPSDNGYEASIKTHMNWLTN